VGDDGLRRWRPLALWRLAVQPLGDVIEGVQQAHGQAGIVGPDAQVLGGGTAVLLVPGDEPDHLQRGGPEALTAGQDALE
jgi:hypothetical protein